MKNSSIIRTSAGLLGLGLAAALPLVALHAQPDPGDQVKSIRGEVVDLMCYLDHGARGEKHRGCATTCIKNGGPVGLLSEGQLYLVIGEHKPMNAELAPKAAQIVTLKGKVVERNGMKMIENAHLEE